MRNKLMLNSDGKPSEAREQMTFFSYVNMKAAQDEKYKMIFAVANGGSRHKLEAINLKRQGVLAGVPDIIVDVPTSQNRFLEGNTPYTDKGKWRGYKFARPDLVDGWGRDYEYISNGVKYSIR